MTSRPTPAQVRARLEREQPEVFEAVRSDRPPRSQPVERAAESWLELSPQQVAQRLVAARMVAIRDGKHCSRPPFGYLRNEHGWLEPDPREAQVVRAIFSAYLHEHSSIGKLAIALDEGGVRARSSKPFSRAALHHVLRNQAYVGRVVHGEIRVRGRHEAIVSQITFNRTQAKLRAKDKRRRTQSRIKGEGPGQATLSSRDAPPAQIT